MQDENYQDTVENPTKKMPERQPNMPHYQSHKTVHAFKIAGIQEDSERASVEKRETSGGAWITPEEKGFLPFHVSMEYMDKHCPEVGGYYVLYQDGYESFSPSDVFEEGYTRI